MFGLYRNIQANLAGNVLPVSTALVVVVVKPLWVLNGSVTGALVSSGGASGVMVASCVGVVAGRVSCTVGFGADGIVGRGTTGADERVGTRVVEQESLSL